MTEQSTGVTVIVIPQPTCNGPLHIGHLSGPYLAADIASRAARARGERVLTLAGIDVHPNYVLTKAENLDMDPGEMQPTSAWWPRLATQNRISRLASSNTGVQTVMSGRCVPPL